MKKDVVSIWKTWRHLSKNKWKDIARLLGWFILQWKYFGGKISGSLVYIGDSTGRCFLYLPSLLLYSTVKGCVTAGGEGRCSVSANRGEVFFFWLSDDTRWWGKWGDDGKCFQRRACPHQLPAKNQARAVFFEKSGFGAKIPRTSCTTTTTKKRLYHSPDSKMLNTGPLTFYSYGNLFPLNIKQVYSPAPVTIDSTLLFTCVKKKQMASTYLM